MKILVNGIEREVASIRTLGDLLRSLGITTSQGGIAVARNDTVVPRTHWEETLVAEGDRFEIITAVQGG